MWSVLVKKCLSFIYLEATYFSLIFEEYFVDTELWSFPFSTLKIPPTVMYFSWLEFSHHSYRCSLHGMGSFLFGCFRVCLWFCFSTIQSWRAEGWHSSWTCGLFFITLKKLSAIVFQRLFAVPFILSSPSWTQLHMLDKFILSLRLCPLFPSLFSLWPLVWVT